MIDQIKEYWGPIVGLAGMFASYVAGREKTRAKISEVSGELERVQSELKTLGAAMSSMQVTVATMATNIDWLKKNAEGK